MLNILVYVVGFVLFVAAQAQNSVRSGSNGLSGWAGIKLWLRLQAVNLATRAFFSMLFYGFVVQWVAAKMQRVGLDVTARTIAGVAGYAANALLYQIFGLLPWLRVEIPDLAPASATNVTVDPKPGV